MHGYIHRYLEPQILNDINNFPVTAILGVRQCGKTSLAKYIGNSIENFLYLDLESFNDLNKIEDPEYFFQINSGKVICLDEIQRKPELFPVLRSIIDRDKNNTKIIILGSASQDLIRQSSETLAGRISYTELTPFTISEIDKIENFDFTQFWLNGGFPESILNQDNSKRWRENFIKTFMERDLPQLGINITPVTMRRFLTMCAHSTGQILNASQLGKSLGLTHTTIKRYIDLMEQTFVIRTIQPYYKNLKKRIIKNSKVYIRDSGILHTLLGINSFNDLLGHPVYGSSWEGFCIENILSELNGWEYSFYRTSNGAELDIVLEKGMEKIGIEFKASTSPKITRGFWNSINDLKINKAFIISPINEIYSIKDNIYISGLRECLNNIKLL